MKCPGITAPIQIQHFIFGIENSFMGKIIFYISRICNLKNILDAKITEGNILLGQKELICVSRVVDGCG